MYLLDIVYVNTRYHEKGDVKKFKVVSFLRAGHIYFGTGVTLFIIVYEC